MAKNRIVLHSLVVTALVYGFAGVSGALADDAQAQAEVKALMQQHRYRDAFELENGIIAKDPKNAAAFRGLANLYLELGDSDNAMKAARTAVSIAPNDLKSVYALARIMQAKQKYDSGLNEYRKAASLNPQLIDPLVGVVQCYEGLNRTKEAVMAAQNLTKTFPKDPLSWSNLAHACLQDHDNDRALLAAQQAVDVAPDSPLGYPVLAQAKSLHRDSAGCRQAAGKWLELDPKNRDAYAYIVNLSCLDAADPALARQTLGKAVNALPDDRGLYLTLCSSLSNQADQVAGSGGKPNVWYELAESAGHQAVVADPKSTLARLMLATVLVKERKYDEALSQVKAVQTEDPRNADAARMSRYIVIAQNDLTSKLRRWFRHQD